MRRRSIFHLTDSPGNAGSLYHAVWVRSWAPSLCSAAGFPSRLAHLRGFTEDGCFSEPVSSPQLLKKDRQKETQEPVPGRTSSVVGIFQTETVSPCVCLLRKSSGKF